MVLIFNSILLLTSKVVDFKSLSFEEDSQYNDTWLIADCDEGDLSILSIDYPQAVIYSVNCD